MNIDKQVSEILNDISESDFLQSDSESFQNHLFGCLSILEILDEESGVFDTGRLHTMTSSGDIYTYDCSENFDFIGNEFGFWEDSNNVKISNKLIWAEYKKKWIQLFELIGKDGKTNLTNQDISLSEQIVLFEEKCYILCKKSIGSECPFVVCIEQGLSPPIQKEEKIYEKHDKTNASSEETSEKINRRNKTMRLKRNVTPIFKRKGFNRTRKAK